MIEASSPGWVDAAATTGRVPIISLSRLSAVWSTGGAGTSSLRLPVDHHPRRAELRVTFGVGGRLRQAQIEATEQRRDRRPATAASG